MTIRAWFRRVMLCGVALTLAPISVGAAEWHVTPNGAPNGDGTEKAPWDILSALGGRKAVHPGDTIWLHGGNYVPATKVWVRLEGEKDKPIIVRNWKNERATLNGTMDIATSEDVPTRYVWVWGLEIQNMGSANPGDALNIGSSSFAAGRNPGVKIINCVIHDTKGNGIGCWGSSEEEVYGCLDYYNGKEGDLKNPNDRGYAHGFYIQSKTHKEFRDNIIFRNFFLGFQIYGTKQAEFHDVTMEGNTLFNSGEVSICTMRANQMPAFYVGAGATLFNPKLIENYTYCPAWIAKASANYGGTSNGLIKGNYFVSPGANKRVALDITLGKNTGLTMTDNTFVGMIKGFTLDEYGQGNVQIPERPTTGKKIFVRKNAYEEGRANITIFNWDKSDKVEVDVSAAGLKKGEKYVVRDAQDFYGKPAAEGTYDEKPIAIPMTGLTVAVPIGRGEAYKAPPHTAPEFGVFVIMKAAEVK